MAPSEHLKEDGVKHLKFLNENNVTFYTMFQETPTCSRKKVDTNLPHHQLLALLYGILLQKHL